MRLCEIFRGKELDVSELKDLGKVAAIVDTESPLSIGLTGNYFGKSFRLTGPLQRGVHVHEGEPARKQMRLLRRATPALDLPADRT